MKNLLKNTIIYLLLIFSLLLTGCNNELKVIDGELPPYEIPYSASVGENPDLESVKIDGRITDGLWESVQAQEIKITTEKAEISCYFYGVITEKGVCFAFKTTDPSVFWVYKMNDANTKGLIKFCGRERGGVDREYKFDPFGAYNHYAPINMKTGYEGDLKTGKISGFTCEGFIPFSNLNMESAPSDFSVEITYHHKSSKVANFTVSKQKFTIVK